MECRHPPAAVTTMTDAFFRGPTMFEFRGQQSGLLKVRVKASSPCLVGHDRTESVARSRSHGIGCVSLFCRHRKRKPARGRHRCYRPHRRTCMRKP